MSNLFQALNLSAEVAAGLESLALVLAGDVDASAMSEVRTKVAQLLGVARELEGAVDGLDA